MSDFRLKVFQCVAKYKNFTTASKELNISQPAVSKHIKELEEYYGIALFERGSNKIELTYAGEILLEYSNEILSKYDTLLYTMHRLSNNDIGSIRIGASTSIAQYTLPQILADFNINYPNIKFSLISANSDTIEDLTQKREIDIGMIEGCSKEHNLKYLPFLKDEIVAIASEKNKRWEGVVPLEEIYKMPLVMREYTSGTYQVIEKALTDKGIDIRRLNICARMDSTESLKNYIQNSNYIGMFSIYAVQTDLYANKFHIIDFDNMKIERNFSFVLPQSPLSSLQQLFISEISKLVKHKYGKLGI